MNFNEYPEYQKIDSEWAEKIPKHWKIRKIKHGFGIIGSGTTPNSQDESYYDGEINWTASGDLTDGYVFETENKITKKAFEKFPTLKLYPKDTLIIALYGATIGKLGILKIDSTTNQACCAITQPKKIHMNFLFYWFLAFRKNIISMGQGGGQPNISQGLITNLRIPVPDIEEQEQIYNFLQKYSKQFDELIAKSKAQITLLEEKRQATIDQAVTKGLDPSVPMKDSGIEWIGEIPEGWEVRPVRYLLNAGKSGIRIGPFGSSLKLGMMKDSGFKIYGQENVINNDFSIGHRFIDEEKFLEMKNYEIVPNDILITMMGTTGKSKTVPESIQQGIMDSHLVRMRTNQNICHPKLFSLILNDASYVQSQLTKLSNGSIMQGLNSQIIKSVKIILPPRDPIDDQEKIFNFLQNKTTQFDELASKIQKQITLLEEKREALITAAVTGKIDVRDSVAA